MSIPANITAELTALQAGIVAAAPIASASYPTIRAVQLNAANLVDDVQTALTAPSALDTWSAPTDPAAIVTAFEGLATAAQDQANLSLMRGLVGRVSANLNTLA